jgi:hypothetical protein
VNWRDREAARIQRELETETCTDAFDGLPVLRWKSNNRLVPPWVFTDGRVAPPRNQQAAYDVETAAFLDDYRRQMANHVPSPEERAEMRAAFGPGAKVVNVITGKVHRT